MGYTIEKMKERCTSLKMGLEEFITLLGSESLTQEQFEKGFNQLMEEDIAFTYAMYEVMYHNKATGEL